MTKWTYAAKAIVSLLGNAEYLLTQYPHITWQEAGTALITTFLVWLVPNSSSKANTPISANERAELNALNVMSYRTMIDFAYPVMPPQVHTDIVLIYAGGDTPHPFSESEIALQPARYRLPCWVRSNPNGYANAISDATEFIAWLSAHKVPSGVTVALDLETAVDITYVTTFDNALTKAGYRVLKYGSLDYIFGNPKTSGGTWVANPTGIPHMVNEGDTVATQYAFDGAYDLSTVLDNATIPLWDTWNTAPPFPTFPMPTAIAPRITLGWSPVNGAVQYHYTVENAKGIVIANSHSNVPYVSVPYEAGMRWRVAVDATHSIHSSPWSQWFTV